MSRLPFCAIAALMVGCFELPPLPSLPGDAAVDGGPDRGVAPMPDDGAPDRGVAPTPDGGAPDRGVAPIPDGGAPDRGVDSGPDAGAVDPLPDGAVPYEDDADPIVAHGTIAPPEVADFDADGLADLLVPVPATGRVHILFGARNRLFSHRLPLDVAGEPWRVAVADLGGSPALDLVVLLRTQDQTWELRAYEGRGDGGFDLHGLWDVTNGFVEPPMPRDDQVMLLVSVRRAAAEAWLVGGSASYLFSATLDWNQAAIGTPTHLYRQRELRDFPGVSHALAVPRGDGTDLLVIAGTRMAWSFDFGVDPLYPRATHPFATASQVPFYARAHVDGDELPDLVGVANQRAGTDDLLVLAPRLAHPHVQEYAMDHRSVVDHPEPLEAVAAGRLLPRERGEGEPPRPDVAVLDRGVDGPSFLVLLTALEISPQDRVTRHERAAIPLRDHPRWIIAADVDGDAVDEVVTLGADGIFCYEGVVVEHRPGLQACRWP